MLLGNAFRVPLRRGETTIPAEQMESIYKKLELELARELAKLAMDGKARCMQVRRSQEILPHVDSTDCYPARIQFTVEMTIGYLNFQDAELGGVVHHAGIMAVCPVADSNSVIELPDYDLLYVRQFRRVSENWWKRER